MIEIQNNNQVKVYNVMPIHKGSKVDSFNAIIKGNDISNVYSNLIYDGQAQRGYIENQDKQMPMINKKHVNDIKYAIKQNKDIGTLTWNIRKENDRQNYKYDVNNHILTINNAKITVPDSAHRQRALYEISKEEASKKLLNNEYILQIHNLTFEQEKEFFACVNGKQLKSNNNRNKFLSNEIKNKLLKETIYNSILNGKVEFIKSITPENKLTKFSTMYDSLFDIGSSIYKDDKITENNYNEYLKWFVSFYNELLSTRQEFNFINKKEEKKETMLLEEMSWWGFHTIMKKLYGDKHWKRRLHNIMNKQVAKVDFWSKKNGLWTGLRNTRTNMKTMKTTLLTTLKNDDKNRRFISNAVKLYLL